MTISGEKMKTWTEIDIMIFCDNITQFLNKHPSPYGKNEKSKTEEFNDFGKVKLKVFY